MTGTFYHRGWFLSHARPLSRCGVSEIIVVADEPLEAPPRVRFACPPRWASVVLGRALSKLIWLVVLGLRAKPDVVMGFHLFPGAMSALIAARLVRAAACYQMTGGPVEIIGGGYQAENRVLRQLRGASPGLERLATAVVREFDLIAVRGNKARRFLLDRGVTGHVTVITAGTELPMYRETSHRPVDVVFVGRLAEIKRPRLFVSVVAAVATAQPNVRVVMVGDGPEMPGLKRMAAELGVGRNIEFQGRRENVGDLLNKAKVFLLTSRSEGLSIAMVEAMAHGVPIVCSDVGELSDLVVNDRTGWLVRSDLPEEYAERIEALLRDEALWRRMSTEARRAADESVSVDRVAQRWREAFNFIVQPGRPSPLCERAGRESVEV